MRILYISSGNPTFVRKDIKLLSEDFRVKSLLYTWNAKNAPLNLIRQFIFLLFSIHRFDAIIVMFAGYWSLLPTVLGKIFRCKTFIILGGTECVSYPSISYGSLRKPLLKKAIQISIKHATCLLPVHESLIKFTNTYFDGSKQGVVNHFNRIKTPVRVIYNGYSAKVNLATIQQSNRLPNSFISVALVNSASRLMLKGIDMILENAAYFPDSRFTIIGIDPKITERITIPANVHVQGHLPYEQLEAEYLKSEFVIQLSISEGFPNALCEAMTHGCIPIVSPVGAMPQITQGIGFTVNQREHNEFRETIQMAQGIDNEEKKRLRVLAHRRIVDNFSEIKRKENLVRTIHDFCSSK